MTSAEKPLVLVPDTNVLIHGNALIDLPWATFGRPTIEVLIVMPVIKELDQLKTQRGRPNDVARKLSSEMRDLVDRPGRQLEIRPGSPKVTKRVDVRMVTTSAHPTLDLDHADQALINYALTLLQEGVDVQLLTNDTFCRINAEGVGVPVRFFPDEWLRRPESDETERENARLKAEIQKLKANEPKVELSFVDDSGDPIAEIAATLTAWQPLTEDEINDLMRRVDELCPMADYRPPSPSYATLTAQSQETALEGLTGYGYRKVFVPPSDSELKRYKTQDYPAWRAEVQAKLQELHSVLWNQSEWPRAIAIAKNAGTRPAAETLVTLRVHGDLVLYNDDDHSNTAAAEVDGGNPPSLPRPPASPQGHFRTMTRFGLDADLTGIARSYIPEMPRFPQPEARQSDSFYWREGRRGWAATLELTCESWRHGQPALEFPLRLRPEQRATTNGLLEIVIEAHNLHEPSRMPMPVRLTVVNEATLEQARALVESLAQAG